MLTVTFLCFIFSNHRWKLSQQISVYRFSTVEFHHLLSAPLSSRNTSWPMRGPFWRRGAGRSTCLGDMQFSRRPMKPVTKISWQHTVALDRCGIVCKYILSVFAIIFTVLGFASLVFGLWLNFQDNDRDMFNIPSTDDDKESIDSQAFDIVVYILVILGSVMVALGIFGEHAACNEKKIALQVFCVLLFLLAVAEITAGALAYTSRDKIGNKLGDLYVAVYKLHEKNKDESIAATLTFVHRSLHCCGAAEAQPVELVGKTCPNLNDTIKQAELKIGQVICGALFSFKIHRDSKTQ
ncbi:CD9 antigen-like [Anableps anableps]